MAELSHRMAERTDGSPDRHPDVRPARGRVEGEGRPVAAAEPVVGAQLDGAWLDQGWATLDAHGAVLTVNDALAGWLEAKPAALVGQNFWSLLAGCCPGEAERIRTIANTASDFSEHWLRRVAAGCDPVRVRMEVVRQTPGWTVRLESVLPGEAEGEEQGELADFPPRAAVQRQLWTRVVRAEAQLKLLSEQWPGVIFSQRADFSFRFVSPRIEELTGIAANDWTRRPELFWQAVHESDADELRDQLIQARVRRLPIVLTYRLRHLRTGAIRYVLEHRRLTLSPGGLVLGYEGVWLDVTRQTLSERRLSSAAWKETLSGLTMGLAHDFSNAMAGIHALVESCLDQIGPEPAVSEDLRLVKVNCREASQLVHQIIDLHQSRTGESYHYDLNEQIGRIVDLVRKLIPRRMQLSFERCPRPLPVLIDAVELRQIIASLVVNAVEAMPPDGHLKLRTEAYSHQPPQGRHWGGPPRWPAVGVTVRDSGSGVAAESMAKLAEPFYTTKPGGGGAGLGLYNARQFAERHRGMLTFHSAPGQGSAVTLLFPESDLAEPVASPVPHPRTGRAP